MFFQDVINHEKLLSLSEGGQKRVGPAMPTPSRKENVSPKKATRESKHSSSHASEHSLPEKLAHVFRALKPSGLSHSPSSSSPFRKHQSQKCELADDVVYISTADHILGKKLSNQKKSKSLFSKHSPSQHNLVSEALMNESAFMQKVSNLDQLRQLYKSVPNVSHTFDEDVSRSDTGFDGSYSCETALSGAGSQVSSKSAGSSLFSAKSPTDSGYRSANRNMDFAESDAAQLRLMSASYHSGGASDPFSANRATVVMINGADESPLAHKTPPAHDNRTALSALSQTPEINWLPFSERDFVILLQKGRCKEIAHLVGVSLLSEIIRIAKLALDGLATEISRLSSPLVKTTPDIVKSATSILFPEHIALSCQKSGAKACSMYALSDSGAFKLSMSQRSGLHFSVGNFYRFLVEVRVSYAVTDQAAVMLCGTLECFVEELVKTAVFYSERSPLSAVVFDKINTLDDLFEYFDHAEHYDKSLGSTGSCYDLPAIPKIKSAEESCCAKTMTEFIGIVKGARPRDVHTKHQLKQTARLSYSGRALKSMFYFVKCRRSDCECSRTANSSRRTIAEWLRVSAIFAGCRMDHVVKEQDVLQTARVLLHVDTPPATFEPNTQPSSASKAQVGLGLLAKGSPVGIDLAGSSWHSMVDRNGFSPISRAIITGDDDAASELLSMGAKLSIPIPRESTEQCPAVNAEFAGWIPLTWAVAHGSVRVFNELITACSEVDETYMIKESPLQVAAVVGDNDMAFKLLACGACPFRSCVNYDSTKCNYRVSGSPSAVALAAARGNWPLMEVMFAQDATRVHHKEEPMTAADFLKVESPSAIRGENVHRPAPYSFMQALSKIGQRAALEAFYYAVETGHIDIALKLRKIGVRWNIHTWIRSLQYAFTERNRPQMRTILQEFTQTLMDDLNRDNIEDVVSVLFHILRNEANCVDGDLSAVSVKIAQIHSRLVHRIRTGEQEGVAKANQRSIIDPKYVDNSELSDIRFKIGSKIIYAHRIVLVNASEEFRELLENPSGLIEVNEVDYAVFKLILQYLYGNSKAFFDELSSYSFTRQFQLYETSARFGLVGVIEECHKLIKSSIDHRTCAQIYEIAKNSSILPLLSDCEDYLLDHLPALVEQKPIRLLLAGTPDQLGQLDLCANLAQKVIDVFVAHHTAAQ
uniref:BTB domain-containing protein n=1 Tax=Steinernema glaseri TaxID=37863 RepID=A0A1I7ZB58_9BILA